MTLDRRRFLAASLGGLAATVPTLRPLSAATGGPEIVLGTHLPLSGPGSVVTTAVRNGLQMRIDVANEGGGIHGRRLRLIVEDNAGQPSQAVRAVDKLIHRDSVLALMCPWGSGTNLATMKRITDGGTVCFSPFAAAALLRTAAGDSPLLFTTNPGYDTTTRAGMAWLLRKLEVRRPGYIFDDSHFGESVGKGLTSALAEHGLPLAASAGYKPGEIDLSAAVSRMKSAGTDLIVCASGTRETIAICREVRKLGWTDVQIVSSTVARNGLTAAFGKETVDGLWGFGAWRIPDTMRPGATPSAWAVDYRRRFGVDADDVALWFHDQADWLVAAIADAGPNPTTDRLVAALGRSRYQGASSYGPQHFAGGHVAPEWTRVERIAGGIWTPQSAVLDPARPRG